MSLLPDIGAHCALQTCNVNDFLPIRCRCDSLFCKDHISPELHSCPSLQTINSTPNAEAVKKLQKCAADKCSKPSLEAFVANSSDTSGRTPAVCERCKQAFCVEHRTPSSHSCAAPDPTQPPVRNEAARAILAKIFPGTSQQFPSIGGNSSTRPAKSRTQISSDPKKVAQRRQVELIKMRHRAQPADPKDKGKHVPVDQRLHVKVSFIEKASEEKLFWFQKSMGTGKALDILSSHFGVSSESSPLYLCNISTGEDVDNAVLHNEKLLVDQVEDGTQLVLRH